ncbi:hypothetical protein KKI95_18335 [Xenorhabdus bovienii]|uniref:hypothetical protein n=1 Tax=Xenorhabdus bovienii TaxID=40576 RepID=UPI0023B2CD07|nr:hypothetical protein [Xenorhabdus bovienii]MDE9437831.1 hypothetical protein [Xenorhabdus bovienii]MDE9499672.1 hypothetical protein [Xenorhabdus bovienii]
MLETINQKYTKKKKNYNFRSVSKTIKPTLYELIIKPIDIEHSPNIPLPYTVTFVRPDPDESYKDQLYLDHIPVPRDVWSFHDENNILSWKVLFGGGQLYFDHNGHGALGVIGEAHSAVSVVGGAKAQFLCSVAENVGAEYIGEDSSINKFKWDTDSDRWCNADWQKGKDRLLLTYTVTPSSPLEPPQFTFEFEDKQSGDIPWEPDLGSFNATLQLLDSESGDFFWSLNFKSSIPHQIDNQAPDASKEPDSVYPFWLQAKENAAAESINGVLVIDDKVSEDKLIGMQGQRADISMVAGYYQVTDSAMPFSVFGNALQVDGQPIGKSKLVSNILYWEGLDEQYQQRLGLPESGHLQFCATGCSANNSNAGLSAKRLTTNAAVTCLIDHDNLYPNINKLLRSHKESLSSNKLDIITLMSMDPFKKENESWKDIVQESVCNDLSQIMNSFIPSDKWKLLFGNTPKPLLTGELAEVAHSPVTGIDNPTEWYQSLSTAVMTNGMANGSDKNCENMNGPRAANWLKEQVTNSKVYQSHSQLLFQYEWQRLFPLTGQYLQDQHDYSNSYNSIIELQAKKSIHDIKQNVISNDASPQNIKDKLINKIKETAQYAKEQELYWAFAYYTYNTAPSMLANIAAQISMNSGSESSVLSRLFQRNISVLTALDSSGYFAQQYTQTFNIFLATNILPTMYGFKGDADDLLLVKEYLHTFVNENINNEDKEIAEATNKIQSILGSKDADEILKNSIVTLKAISDTISYTLALPYIANNWLKWFQGKYPKLASVGSIFGSVLISGIATLGVFNLFLAYKNWNKLSPAKKTQVILNSCQLGLQILAAVVKRGVRIYSIFSVSGMTVAQRSAAVARIFVSGEVDQISEGMQNISNNIARWLGDTAGSESEREAWSSMARYGLFEEMGAEEVTWTTRIFGRNLDEFISTRVGPLFILAGIGLSIYFIGTGETGVALASDIINIVGSSLTLFAMLGEWAIAEGTLATMVSVAGPLAIVCAVVGIGLMIYKMFQKQPDPVEEFVNTYVKSAGFYVASKCSAIDYVTPYISKANKLEMKGFTLTFNDKALICNIGGNISLGNTTSLPNCVWQVTTNGLAISQIVAAAPIELGKPPMKLRLSLMSDNSVSFQPPMASSNNDNTTNVPMVVTQSWLSHPVDNASTTNDDNDNYMLQSLNLIFQPIKPDSEGNYDPAQASGWLVLTDNRVAYSNLNYTYFRLTMAAIAPNYMSMKNLSFSVNIVPSKSLTYGPTYLIKPSLPMNYSVNPPLPDFLTLTKIGQIKPTGKKANEAISSAYTLTVNNPILGNESILKTSFMITVTAKN